MTEQTYYIGLDIDIHIRSLLQKLNVVKVFLVRGRDSYILSGASSVLECIFSDINIQQTCFFDFSSNPKMEEVHRGVALCKRCKPDIIIAIGGGSAIDVAKLIRYYSQSDTEKQLPLIAVPTTAGTGAESTSFSVCYVDGEKHSIADKAMLPDYAFIYPPFTYNNNNYLTACTGFDAIAQAMESYWSVKSTDESREWSVKALNLLWKQLPQLIKSPEDKNLRMQIATGAYYAGRAINITTTTAPHAFSYKFTSLYGIPHGHAVALTFPFFFALNTSDNNLQNTLNSCEYAERIEFLMKLLECEGDGVDFRQSYMSAYISLLCLQVKSFNTDEITCVINSFNAQRAENNPVVIDERVKVKLYHFLNEAIKLQ